MSTEDDFERLTHEQRLKAAVHYSSLKICQELCAEEKKKLSKMVVATISETTWRKMEQFTFDLEHFAKHAKRTTVNADDVKMLIRKSPKLLQHINGVQEQMNASKGEAKKKTKKSKVKDTTGAAKDATEVMNVDEESRQ